MVAYGAAAEAVVAARANGVVRVYTDTEFGPEMEHRLMGGSGAEPSEKLRRKDYEEELRRLQVELVHLQRWIVQEHAKVCIVFEGRDTAGKGGVIKRLTERVSPRVFRVVALPAPERP